MLTNTPAALRLTLVSDLGTPSDGGTLAGQNVNDFPDGALFFVQRTARFYQLVKNLSTTVVPASGVNVIAGIGSSDAAGRFIAVQQAEQATLVAGVAVVTGLYLPATSAHSFLVCMVTPGGTPGFVHAARTTDHSATITSTSNTDTSTYLLVVISADS